MFADRQLRHRRRNWKLQELENVPKQAETYTEFLEDLEEDKDYRKNIDIYIGWFRNDLLFLYASVLLD